MEWGVSFKKISTVLVGVIFSVAAASPAAAATIKVELTGSIFEVDAFRFDIPTLNSTPLDIYDPVTGPFGAGDSVTITMTFSTNSAGTPSGGGTLYSSAVTYDAQIGDFTVIGAAADLTIGNDVAAGVITIDRISVLSLIDGTDNVSHAIVGDLPLSNISFSLRDNNHTALSDEILSADKFNAALFNSLAGSLVFEALVDENTLDILGAYFNFDSITVTEISDVPLPAALPLFLVGIAGIRMTAHRRRKGV